MTNIATWLADSAAEHSNLPAIKQGETVLTYAQLDQAVARCATLLASKGIRAGDNVALTMPNVAYFPVVYYAILRLGAVVVPMNPLLKAGEIAYTWRDARAKVAVVFALFAAEAASAATETGTEVVVVTPGEFDAELAKLEPTTDTADRNDTDTAVIFYTSGTTGRPKGAELSHSNLSTNVKTTLETLLPMAPGDMIFGGLPLFHSFGQTCGLNSAIASGATLDLLPRFDGAEALRMVAEDKVSVFLGVPTMYMALLGVPDKESYDTSSLRYGASGGASLPLEVLRGVEETFNFKLLEGYGLSETSPVASFNHPHPGGAKPGSVGQPIKGVEFKLTDIEGKDVESPDSIGEICVRGENVMKGYWDNAEATAAAVLDGWFHTGDLATRDADGFYFIVDRKKDMINRNGFNVYPREIEEVLYTHPAIAEAAVFGIPDSKVGEEIGALVTLKDGAEATAEEIIEFARERIAAYKYPRKVKFGALPKGPTGKILKREISFQ